MKYRQQRIHVLFGAVVMVLAAAGCPSEKVLVTGCVAISQPIKHADLMVYTLDGVLVGRYFNETQQEGTFVISVPKAMAANGLRIIADDGALADSGEPFDDNLTAEIPAPGDGLNPLVHVGLPSTLCAAYRAVHPELTIAEANAIVADFLQLPETIDITHDLIFYADYFDHGLFLAESDTHESLSDFISDLVAEPRPSTP